MRKTTIVAIALVLMGGLTVAAVLYGPTMGQSGHVRKLALAFMSDLQFKDFRSSSIYTHPLERDRVDIGHALERLFLVKPEFLDLREYKVVKLEVDDDKRARVLIRTVFQRLNMKKEPEEGEVVLYFIKRHPDCPMGSTCTGGRCINEFGQEARRTDEKEKEGDKPKIKPKESPKYEAAKAKGDTYACSETNEPQWFMNLDSTLKEKKYNN